MRPDTFQAKCLTKRVNLLPELNRLRGIEDVAARQEAAEEFISDYLPVFFKNAQKFMHFRGSEHFVGGYVRQ